MNLCEAEREFTAGDLTAAENNCRAILRQHPSEADAQTLLADILYRRADYPAATALLQSVLERDPTNARALRTLREVCEASGHFDAAVAAFSRAARVRRDDPVLWAELGRHRAKTGDWHLAAEALRQAVALHPESANYHVALGTALTQLSRFDEAVAVYRQALALHPGVAELHAGLGAALMSLGRCDDAIAAYHRAVTLAPQRAVDWLADANYALALQLRARARHPAAAAALEQCLALRPRWPDAHNALGVALKEMGRIEDAIRCFRRAIEIEPRHALAHSNLGAVLGEQGDLETAAAELRTSIALAPTAESCGNLGNILGALGETDEARALFERAVACDPGHAIARHNRAIALLLDGDLKAGFAEYEWRRKALVAWSRVNAFAQPEWNGEALGGRTVMLYAEQGLGDTIQFVRFAPEVAARGGRVVLRVQDSLVRLVAGSYPTLRVVGQSEPLPPLDCQFPLMSLPWRLETTLATIPGNVPYLVADADKVAHWRARLTPAAGLKIGLVFAGNPATRHDRHRSIPLRELLRHLPDAGVSLFSLQKELRPDDAATLASAGGRIADLAPDLVDFSDTAAAVTALDLVISVDTAVAHLAGALARPAWVLLHQALDWRWLRDRADSPWYPTLRLFRQSRGRDWADVLTRVGAAVRDVAAAHRSPTS